MIDELVRRMTLLERRLDNLVLPEVSLKIYYNQNPAERWLVDGASDLIWTGWAAYAGFITPNTISIAGRQYLVYDTASTGRMFRYRPYINAQTAIQTLCFGQLNTEVGIMVDDGVGNADGNGANNFVRAFLEWAGTGIIQLTTEYRLGGGAVTKTIHSTPLPPTDMVAFKVIYGVGARWANWSAYVYIGTRNVYDSTQAFPYLATIVGGMAWTPARHGLYGRESTISRALIWHWFDE